MAGKRLDKALDRAGISRASLYVTNAVLCHPPENTSTAPPKAVEACHDRLIREIRERKPSMLLALGVTAVFQCTGDRRPLSLLRQLAAVPSPYVEEPTVIRATYHPSPLALNVDPLRSRQFDEDVAWLGGQDPA
jgi:uracil-DNA glycosylase